MIADDFNAVHVMLMKKLSDSPADVMENLSFGLSVDHVLAVTVSIHSKNLFCPDSASSENDDSHEILHSMPKNRLLQGFRPFGALPFPTLSPVPAHIQRPTLDSRDLYLLPSEFNIAFIYFFVNTPNCFILTLSAR